MKNGIVNIWLLGIIVIFIALFSAYIIITINYSRSFKMKNEILTIIEKHKGVTSNISSTSGTSKINGSSITTNVNTVQTINLYLKGNHYEAMGHCPEQSDLPGVWYGVKELGTAQSPGSTFELAQSNEKYYYCFAKYKANLHGGKYEAVYYRVRMFYKFEVPVLENFLSVKVEGITDEIFDPQDGAEGKITVSDGTVYNING